MPSLTTVSSGQNRAAPAFITVDGFLVQRVDKVAGILDGVLEVADGLEAATLGPEALLGRLRLVLDLTESDLLWADEESTNQGGKGSKSFASFHKRTEIKVLVRSHNLTERLISHSDLDGEEAELIYQVHIKI